MTLLHKVFDASKDESGAGTVTGLFVLLTAIMVGGLAVDYTNGIRARAQLQTVADSAALAGVIVLEDGEAEARKLAMDVAEFYGPGLLKDADIIIGSWSNGSFDASSVVSPNAVRVITRRSDENDNPLQTFLLQVVGIDRMNVSTLATSSRVRRQHPCSGGGYFARGIISANSSNTYSDGFCLHGQQAIHLHNTNRFEPGTVVSTPDLANVYEHRNNTGLAEALRPATYSFSRSIEVPDLFHTIRSEGLNSDILPPYITKGPVYLSRINNNDSLAPNTLYIVNGDVSLRGNRLFDKVAILASGSIDIQSNVELRDVVLATDESINITSNVQIGGSEADYCLSENYSSYLLTRRDITMGSNNALRGILMASMGDIVMNSNNAATQGVYAEATGDIIYNSSASKQGCGKGYGNELLYADRVGVIVQ